MLSKVTSTAFSPGEMIPKKLHATARTFHPS